MTGMLRPTHHYIGRCPYCGTVQASVYDMSDDPKFTAGFVAKMIAQGLKVERVPLGSVEFSPERCKCASNPVRDLPLFQTEAL